MKRSTLYRAVLMLASVALLALVILPGCGGSVGANRKTDAQTSKPVVPDLTGISIPQPQQTAPAPEGDTAPAVGTTTAETEPTPAGTQPATVPIIPETVPSTPPSTSPEPCPT